MKFIMTAFTNLDLALKLLAVAEDGQLTRASIKDGESITWQSGKSLVVLPDHSFHSDDDFILALQNNVTIAFGAAAITLNVCREEMGILVLLCYLIGPSLTRRQQGHRGRMRARSAPMRSRKLVIEDGTWRCARRASARLVMRG